MAIDMQEVVLSALKNAAQGAGGTVESARDTVSANGRLSGMKGIAAGAGAAALAPIAIKGASKLAKAKGLTDDGLGGALKSPGRALGGVTSGLGDRVSATVNEKIEDAGGPSGIMKDAAKGMLPFGGSDDDGENKGKGGVPGVGKGRRMPVQQSVDIGVPVDTVYNQWTRFEQWPNFMHRVTRVMQEDDCTVMFAVKVWGKTKEFTANIETQRPGERMKWRVSEGMDHTGVVTFHELGPNLTRVLLGFDVQPGGMLEKLARGARHVKRAARGDLHRFKAFIEMAERETGAWRGVIEDGEVVQEHDPSYDKQRDYSDIEQLVGERESDGRSDDKRGSTDDKRRSTRKPRSRSGSGQGGTRQSRGRGESASRRGSSRGSTSGRSRASQTSSGRRSGSNRRS